MNYQSFLGTPDFVRFCDELELKLCEIIPERLPGAAFRRQWIDKLQGESYLSFTINPKDSAIGINLNVSDLYAKEVKAEGMVSAARVRSIASEMLEKAIERLKMIPVIDDDLTDNYEKARPKLITQLVAVRGNEDMLRRIPYRQIEDLALVYRLFISSENGIETCLISSSMLEDYGVTAEQLHQDAMANMSAISPVTIKDLQMLLADLAGAEAAEEVAPELPDPEMPKLYFLGTGLKYLGASAIFYPGVLERCAETLGGNYYILPSSIHEVLLLKDDGTVDPEKLSCMIYEINRATVEPSERLTDHPYYYDCGTKEFRST